MLFSNVAGYSMATGSFFSASSKAKGTDKPDFIISVFVFFSHFIQ
jgi:hypothetical protein